MHQLVQARKSFKKKEKNTIFKQANLILKKKEKKTVLKKLRQAHGTNGKLASRASSRTQAGTKGKDDLLSRATRLCLSVKGRVISSDQDALEHYGWQPEMGSFLCKVATRTTIAHTNDVKIQETV